MLSILSNQWVVGIGAGIISGVIVYFLTRWLLGRKDNSKHIEQINMANEEIIRILRPYVAEEGLPNKDIVNAILASSSRKYNLQQNEVYSIRVVCEELIKETLENVYVSCSKKQEYSMSINDYLIEIEKPLNDTDLSNSTKLQLEQFSIQNRNKYKNRYLSYLSGILSVFVFIITTFGTIFSKEFSSIPFTNDFDIVTIATLVSTSMVVTVVLVLFMREILERKKKIEEEQKKGD